MKLLFAILVALPKPSDSFFGADKMKHFFLSAFVQSVAFGGLRSFAVDRPRALRAAGGVTAAVGLGKELYDSRRTGLFSVRDLVWDAAGAAVATQGLRRTGARSRPSFPGMPLSSILGAADIRLPPTQARSAE